MDPIKQHEDTCPECAGRMAVLAYNLDTPEGGYSFESAQRADRLRFALDDVREAIRRKHKYCENAEISDAFFEFQKEFFQILEDKDIAELF